MDKSMTSCLPARQVRSNTTTQDEFNDKRIMVAVLTKFEAVDKSAAEKLESIFKKLICEVKEEQGYISYEVYSEKNEPHIYFIFEKWHAESDLQKHADNVEGKGYMEQALPLISNSPENIILKNLK
ncbi:putative quinol monooxygenase [Sinomicrobium sp. M5D2P9]